MPKSNSKTKSLIPSGLVLREAYISTFIYATSLFEAYFQDLLLLLFRTFPKSLISSKTVTHDKVFSAVSLEALKDQIITEQMAEISYKSIKDQLKALNDRFSVDAGIDEQQKQNLIEISATRNLHVHNKGIVNDIYLRLVSNAKYKLNEVRAIDNEYLGSSINLLALISEQLASESLKKVAGK